MASVAGLSRMSTLLEGTASSHASHGSISSLRLRAQTPDHGTPPAMSSGALSAALGGAPPVDDLEQLWDNDDADESFEVPDFHFDWGVKKDGKDRRASGGGGGAAVDKQSALAAGRPASSASSSSKYTPPTQPAYAGSATTASSASSTRALTDASTADNSALIPTPPGQLVSRLDGERKFTTGRTFGRVVSAPVRGRYDDADEPNALASSSSGRAMLPQHEGGGSPGALPAMHRYAAGSNNDAALPPAKSFITPGASRLMTAGLTSTARRTGGLSRFGGPARRVPMPEPDESEEGSPGLSEMSDTRQREGSVDSVGQSPALTAASSTIRAGSSRDRTATADAERPDPEPLVYPRHGRVVSASVLSTMPPGPASSGAGLSRASPPVGERRHRATRDDAYHIVDQENSKAHDYHAARYAGKSASMSDASILERPPPQPLRPAHSLPRTSESPEGRRQVLESRGAAATGGGGRDDWGAAVTRDLAAAPVTTLRATRPAPVQPDPPAVTQTAPAAVALPPATESAAAAAVPPPATVTKRSFLVNGVPYERLGILGKGGSSKVYSVLCPTNRIVYALKRVALDRADAETYQSYTNEIELLKRLKGHDRIIQLIDHQISFSQNNRPKMLMMVMECGEIDFAALLDEQRGRPLNMNFVGLYFQQMLEAVQAVHAENVVHTDLKPANFVLVKGRLKIIDFGIAKAIANDTVNIQRDQQIGTVNYMSPEAIQRMNNQKVLKLSYPSDVWSLGCILYQMIYGAPPFQHIGGGPLPKMNAIADPRHTIAYPASAVPRAAAGPGGQLVDLSHLAVPVSPAAINAMQCCLAYQKEERLTIPELLRHEFLAPSAASRASVADGERFGGRPSARLAGLMTALPPGATSITKEQMAMLVNFVLTENNLPVMHKRDTTAEDLFAQLSAQNALTRGA